METITKNGKKVNVNRCGRDAQARMLKNGWHLMITESCSEGPQELYDRLVATGRYTDIRVFWHGTRIPGIHNYFAFVK